MLNLLGAVFFGLCSALCVGILLGGVNVIEAAALLVAAFVSGVASRQCLIDYRAQRARRKAEQR